MTSCIWTSYFLTNKRNIFTFLFSAFQFSGSYFSAFFSANRNENTNLDFQTANPTLWLWDCAHTCWGHFFFVWCQLKHIYQGLCFHLAMPWCLFIIRCAFLGALFSPSEKQEIGVCLTWQVTVALTRAGSSKPTHFDRKGFINNVHRFLLCQCKCISSTTGFHLFYPECLRVMNKS